jgi:hypothetical protein
MGIFSLVALFTLGALGSGLRGVLLAKHREVATEEANRILEIARSLSYNDVGLVQTPTDPTIATDTANIQQHNSVLSYLVNGVWEPIVWATNMTGHPFNPHIQTLQRGSTTLKRYVYVTGVDTSGDGIADVKRVTARVSWDNTTSSAANEVRAQTMINESGIVPTGPGSSGGTTSGLTPLTATTHSTGGSLTIEDALIGTGVPLHISLPTSDGSSTFRAVSNTNCTTRSASLEAGNLGNAPGYSVSVTADDDSRTPTSSQPSAKTSNGVLTVPAGALSTILGSSIGSPISCEASVNPLGHELGSASALTAMNAQHSVVALGGLLNWLLTLASIQTQPVSQEVTHEVVSGNREVHSSSTTATGLINVLKIPGVIADGLVRVDATNIAASVRASEGTPSQAPSVTAPAVNLRVFDNGNHLPNGSVCQSHQSGYCLLSVNPSSSGFTGLSIDVTNTFTQLVGLNVVNLSYTTSVDIFPPSKSPTAGVVGPNGERRWSAEYTPMAISASLDASVLGASIIDSSVGLNLGTVQAKACAGTTCT